MIKRSIILYLLGFLFFIVNELSVVAQNIDDLYNFVDNKQKSSVEKAFKEISEAGKLTQESSEFYNEVLALQTNYELDEKTLQKKLVKTEQKAISLQIKADKLYASAYKSLYDICQDIIESSGESDSEIDNLKNAALEMIKNAENKREKAKINKNVNEKAILLNDAAGMEAAAIDYLISAIQIQNGVIPARSTQVYTEEPTEEQYSKTVTTPISKLPGDDDYVYSVQQKSENLAIDMNVIGKYKEYVTNGSIPDLIIINRSGVIGSEDISLDHARNIVFNYHYGYNYTFSEQDASNQQIQPVINSANPITSLDHSSDLDSYIDSRAEFDLSATLQASDIIFMIEITASRIPLTRSQLWAILPGNFTIQVIKEDDWYKYRMTGFRLYSEAERVASESGVEGAWILSSQRGMLIDLKQAREMTRVLEADVERYGYSSIKNQIDFYVQIIASKNRLEEDVIGELSESVGFCREIIEEGWFKYQIYAGNEYEKASKIRDQLTRNSFIVAYKRGTKIDIKKAINKSN